MNNHLDENNVLLFLYRELPEHEQLEAQTHIATCATCLRELTLLQETLRVYQHVPQEVPHPEILSRIVTRQHKNTFFLPQVRAWLELFFMSRQKQWAIALLAGILLIAGVVYVSNLRSPLESLEAGAELEWKSNVSDSLETLSRRILLLQKKSATLPGITATEPYISMETIDTEVSALRNRITNFSTSLSINTF